LLDKKNFHKWEVLTNFKDTFVETEIPAKDYPPGLKEPATFDLLLKLKFGTEHNAKFYKVERSLKKFEQGITKPEDCILTMDDVIEGSSGNLAAELRSGFSGIGVRGAVEHLAGGLIQKNNYVKIFAVKRAKDAAGREYPKPIMVMQQIRVIVVDQDPDVPQSGGASSVRAAPVKIPTTVTLEVTDREAAHLTLAQREGPVSLLVIAQADVLENATPEQRKGENWDETNVDKKNPISHDKTERVFVAARKLHPGTPIKDFVSLFELKEIPAWKKPERAVTLENFDEFRKVTGTHVLAKAMNADEPLSLNWLKNKDLSSASSNANRLLIIDTGQQTYKEDPDGGWQPVKSPGSATATKS